MRAIETADLAVLSTAAAYGLGSAQVGALTTAQIVVINTADVAALSTAGISGLNTAQVVALTTAQVGAFNTADVGLLSTANIVALTTAQMGALGAMQIAAMTTAQLLAMETVDVASLTSSAIGALTTAQAPKLTTAFMRALTTKQMQSLTTADLVVMTSTQIIALSTCALTPLQTQALGTLPTGYTPIVLDLNGDGIQTIAADSGVRFDLLGTGEPEKIGWVAPSDGLLVMDINADGVINDGKELFGSGTLLADGSKAADGYQALAELDTNHDGVITSSDATFAQLGVWVDSNSDGLSQSGEVHSLRSLGITSISLQAVVSAEVNQGNTIGLSSSYQTSDGVNHLAGDVWFAVAQSDTNPVVNSTAKTASLVEAIGEFSSEQYAKVSTVETANAALTVDLNAEEFSPKAFDLSRANVLAAELSRFDPNGNALDAYVGVGNVNVPQTATAVVNFAAPVIDDGNIKPREWLPLTPPQLKR